MECSRCGFISDDPQDFHVHHIDLVNINTELADHSLENLCVLCVKCHKKYHRDLIREQKKYVGLKDIEIGVHHIFKGLNRAFNLDLSDENFKDTPKRIARAYVEIFAGVENTKERVAEILSTAFPAENTQVVIAKDIHVFSMCPHHLLPVDYKVNVAYLPSKAVLGISKLSRLVKLLAQRPVLQEQFVTDIVDALMTIDGCIGAACIAQGKHYCMIMRGIQQENSSVVCSALRGSFLSDAAARAELMGLIK